MGEKVEKKDDSKMKASKEVEVLRLHSKNQKVFCALGQHHRHLSENHSAWIDIPSKRICSLQRMTEVQFQFSRQKSVQDTKPELREAIGDDIYNALSKQPSVLKLIEENEQNIADDAKQSNDVVLIKTDYVFKSIDKENNKIVCLDADFNDIAFELIPSNNKELFEKINKVIQDG